MKKELEGDTSGKDFLTTTDNKLQGNLDIIFFRYWNTEKARSSDLERYITAEQSQRLFDDLVRGNEDVAIPTLKEYVKYKMAAVADENDAVKEKKTAFMDERKKAAADDFDKDLAEKFKKEISAAAKNAHKSKNSKDLEIAIAKAKAVGVEVSEDDEATVKEVQEARDKADEARVAGLKEDKQEGEKAKNEKRKEEVAKAVEKATADGEKDKEAVDADKTKKEEEAGSKAEEEFTKELKQAISKSVQKMEEGYKKRTFILRGAALTAFLESTTDGLSEEEGKTITQNDLNKIMNLTAGEKFDAFVKALGFSTEDFEEVVSGLQLPDESGFVKEDGEKKE